MPYTLSVLPAAEGFLLKLRDPLLLARLERAIQALRRHPRPVGVVKLSAREHH